MAIVIGISGVSRSGKGWVSKGLIESIEAAGMKAIIVAQDNFWFRSCKVVVKGSSRSSQEEPECTDHKRFLKAIKDKLQSYDVVIAEGFQLLYSEEIASLLDHIFLIELDKDEARKRRIQPRDKQMNPNPLTPEDWDDLLWPAHERYMVKCVAPLEEEGKIVKLNSPTNIDERNAAVKQIEELVSWKK
eukprot:TRINITY_DN11861_c0_g2_i1.p1 TRINITY_DN11861_c0_g2~~TRINITY_DN11861_c0_g2_i1.p1  ORF type:complete len:188 (-),score=37.17 TRINITY_DN11861_c0_g2_i1:358-921(-)